MVFASVFLMLAYVCFVCVCYTVAVILPVMFLILAALSLILLVVLAILWFKLKKKGWFSREYQSRKLSEEGGYWKVMGMKAIRVAMIVLMIIAGVNLVVCLLLTAAIFG